MKTNSSANITSFFDSDKKESSVTSHKSSICDLTLDQNTKTEPKNKEHHQKHKLSLKKKKYLLPSPIPTEVVEEVSFDSFLSALNGKSVPNIEVVNIEDDTVEMSEAITSNNSTPECETGKEKKPHSIFSLSKSPKPFTFTQWCKNAQKTEDRKTLSEDVVTELLSSKSEFKVCENRDIADVPPLDSSESVSSNVDATSQEEKAIDVQSHSIINSSQNEINSDCEVEGIPESNSKDNSSVKSPLNSENKAGLASIFDPSTWQKNSTEKNKIKETLEVQTSPLKSKVEVSEQIHPKIRGRPPKLKPLPNQFPDSSGKEKSVKRTYQKRKSRMQIESDDEVVVSEIVEEVDTDEVELLDVEYIKTSKRTLSKLVKLKSPKLKQKSSSIEKKTTPRRSSRRIEQKQVVLDEPVTPVVVERKKSRLSVEREAKSPGQIASLFNPSTWSEKSKKKSKEECLTTEEEDTDCCIILKETTPMNPEKANFLRGGLPSSMLRSKVEASCSDVAPMPEPFPKVSHVTNINEIEAHWLEQTVNKKFDFKMSENCASSSSDLSWRLPRIIVPGFHDLEDSKVIDLEPIEEREWSEYVETIKAESPSFPAKRFLDAFLDIRKEVPPLISVENTSASDKPKRKSSLRKLTVKESKSEATPIIEDATTVKTLWSDKYAPYTSASFLGNNGKLRRLKEWLDAWKVAMDRESRHLKKQLKKERAKAKRAGKPISDSDDDFHLSDCSTNDSRYSDMDHPSLAHTFLIAGPHGAGKTALAHALANQLGYKVFEVNASSRRSGKDILQQLQEAVVSKHVAKDNLSKVFSTFHMTQNLQSAQISSPPSKPQKRKRNSQDFFSPKAKKARVLSTKTNVGPVTEKPEAEIIDTKTKGLNLTSCSLVLFDEVDLMFEEDKGFWSAITTLMQLNKRPIVMTARDPLFLQRMGVQGSEHCTLTPPTDCMLGGYLRLVLMLEGWKAPLPSLTQIAKSCRGDIRRAINTLQLCVYGSPSGHHPLFLPHTPEELVTAGQTNLDDKIAGSMLTLRGVSRSLPKPPPPEETKAPDCSLSEIFTTEAPDLSPPPPTPLQEQQEPVSQEEQARCDAGLDLLSSYLDSLSVLDGIGSWPCNSHTTVPSCCEEVSLVGRGDDDNVGLGADICHSWLDYWTLRLEHEEEESSKEGQISPITGQHEKREKTSTLLSSCHDNVIQCLPPSNRLHSGNIFADHLPYIRRIASVEAMKKVTSTKRRFFHYFDKISFNIKDSTLDVLCEDF